jgi:hypothetical protein
MSASIGVTALLSGQNEYWILQTWVFRFITVTWSPADGCSDVGSPYCSIRKDTLNNVSKLSAH